MSVSFLTDARIGCYGFEVRFEAAAEAETDGSDGPVRLFSRALARLTRRVPNASGSQVREGTPQRIDGGMDAQGSEGREPLAIEVVQE